MNVAGERAPVVDLAHVNVFRGSRLALKDLTLRIGRGEQVALLGPNGCGKTTLLKTLLYELYPEPRPETKIALFGRERWELTELRRRLGVVQNDLPGKPFLRLGGFDAILTGFFSSSTLWPHLVVTGEMREAAERVLRVVGAERLRDHAVGEMSSGQQRRIVIGRALVASSGCLLLDEPSNALDLRAQQELRGLLAELAAEGTTLFEITHQVADILPGMRRVLLMRDGRIVADGDRAELLTERALSELFEVPVRLAERDGVLHAW